MEKQQMIPLEFPKSIHPTGTHIESGRIMITLPKNVTVEQLTAVLSTLKSR